jgi:WD40 repeat protein
MSPTITPQTAPTLSAIGSARFGWISALAWSPDGRRIAVGGGDGLAIWMDSFGGQPTHRPIITGHAHLAPVNDIAFSLDGMWLGSTSATPLALLHHLDPKPGDIPGVVYKDRTDVAYTALAIKTDHQIIAIGHSDGHVRVYDQQAAARDPQKAVTLQFDMHHGHEVSALAFRAGRLYSAGRDGRLVSVDPADISQPPVTIARQADWIRDFVLTPSGQTAFTVCKDGSLAVWDTQKCALIRVVTAHQGGADAVAYSRIGGILATGGRDCILRLWDVKGLLNGDRLTPIAEFAQHTKPILALAFNPTGALLLSGGGDNLIRLWASEMITPF